MNKQLKNGRSLFWIVVCINFIMILTFNFLTPYMSDDLWYDIGVLKSPAELLQGSVNAYMTWTGRNVADFLLRLSFCMPKWLFNIINSALFITLTLLIYANIDRRKKNDVTVYGYVMLFMWLYAVSFDQTILWVSGACNYLWTANIIMAFVTVYRVKMCGLKPSPSDGSSPGGANTGDRISKSAAGYLPAVGMFFLGLLAGWGNENTSGGAFLIALTFTLIARYAGSRESGKSKLPLWSVTGLIGSVIGMIIMVTAPGVRVRASERLAEENQTGMMAILGRLLKINDAVTANLSILLCITIVLIIYLKLKGKTFSELKDICIYLCASVITAYVLILTTVPMDRALFGAGLFLIIACIQAIMLIPEDDTIVTTAKYGFLVIMALSFFVQYLSSAADLYRIERELNERDEIVAQFKGEGNLNATLPRLRPDWDNRYTYIYSNGNDVDEEEGSYGNSIYAEYYGLKSVRGIPREEWDAEE